MAKSEKSIEQRKSKLFEYKIKKPEEFEDFKKLVKGHLPVRDLRGKPKMRYDYTYTTNDTKNQNDNNTYTATSIEDGLYIGATNEDILVDGNTMYFIDKGRLYMDDYTYEIKGNKCILTGSYGKKISPIELFYNGFYFGHNRIKYEK